MCLHILGDAGMQNHFLIHKRVSLFMSVSLFTIIIGVSPEMYIQERFDEDLLTIQKQFAVLLSGTRASLHALGVLPRKVVTCAIDLSYVTANDKTSVLNDHKRELMDADSIDDIFIALSSFWNFLNYDLLKHIIITCGLDLTDLNTYEERLESFCKRSIFQLPPNGLGSSNGDDANRHEVHMKIDLDHPTLKDVLNIRQKISKILQVHPLALFIHNIKSGCVEVEFLVPQCITQQLFPLTDEQTHSLHYQEHVMRIKWRDMEVRNRQW